MIQGSSVPCWDCGYLMRMRPRMRRTLKASEPMIAATPRVDWLLKVVKKQRMRKWRANRRL